jgi:hypothetical protein
MIKSNFLRLSALIAVLMLVGCSSGPDIRSDYDRSVDFGQFKTFNFFNPMGIENPNYSTIYGSIFRESISREMESRGYVMSDDPDLLLNVSAQLQDKTKVTTYNDPYPAGYYGYRRGYYDPWMGYPHGTSTHVSQYTQGTVNVDMVDARAKRMIWEGVAVGRVKEGRSNDQVRAAIDSGVTEMFSAFPFRAGQ